MVNKKYSDVIREIQAIGIENLDSAKLFDLDTTAQITQIIERLDLSESEEVLEGFVQKNGVLEQIIRLHNRPVIEISSQTFNAPQSSIWSDTLLQYRTNIENAIKSVGRVELKDHPNLQWAGTAWRVTEDIAVTNRHVAQHFIERSGSIKNGSFVFKKNLPITTEISANIDFAEERSTFDKLEVDIIECVWMAPDLSSEPDIALLRIDIPNRYQSIIGSPIQLRSGYDNINRDIVVVGYPARNSQSNIPIEMSRIFSNFFDVKRLQPAVILRQEEGLITHDASTLPGNSGSPVIDIISGRVVGVHYGGFFSHENYAVTSEVLGNLLSERNLI